MRCGQAEFQPDVRKYGVWQRDAPLTNPGRLKMMRAAQGLKLWGCITEVHCSTYPRAVDSMEILVHTLGLKVGAVRTPNESLDPCDPDEWDHEYATWLGDRPMLTAPMLTPTDLRRMWPRLIDNCILRVHEGSKKVVEGLGLEETALLVSHNPLVSFAEHAWSEMPFRALIGCGESVILEFTDDHQFASSTFIPIV